MPSPEAVVAYFSMELALENQLPTYSGGLGVLAGDTLRSAADQRLSMVGVSLVHRCGYFFQRLNATGTQIEEPVQWSPDDWLEPVDAGCEVDVEGRRVQLRAWRYLVAGCSGGVVPVFLLDTDVDRNDGYDRRLTDALYGGDQRYRLCQEVILGIGGVRLLRALGYDHIGRFHMNEGHSALLALELLGDELKAGEPIATAVARVARRCVFTTHTPVPAGQDQFSPELARRVLGRDRMERLAQIDCCTPSLNMTLLGLRLSHYVNGVTRRHGEISRSMFPGYPIQSITNGVHSATWTAPPFQRLFDRTICDWRRDPHALRYASNLALDEIASAHDECKRRLVAEINERTNAGFDKDVLTVGSARRATAYKRPLLLFRDPERLRSIARRHGGLQLVFAGKAHPADLEGKALIAALHRVAKQLRPEVRIAFLPNYDLEIAKLLTAGVDVWLNTPRPPMEASGTSGMKAAHNGVPSLSMLDGWWIEGCVEGVTGWGIGSPDGNGAGRSDDEDAADLYRVLDEQVAPLYRRDSGAWAKLMRSTIAVNASFFNTHRMLDEYIRLAYGAEVPAAAPVTEPALEAARSSTMT
jgi:glycogen phosphorylase